VLRLRTSPRQLCLCIKELTKKQRDAVRSLGFGKILSIKVDGIPSKLGHFVVDRFNPETMEIKLGDRSIKVDEDSIHQLMGIPNGGVDIESCGYKKNFIGKAKEWKKLYKGAYIKPSQIVQRIADNGDDDGIMFKLDFLVLFISVLVESQDNGKCKLDFLHYITDDTEIANINWCKYITSAIKKCKNGWQRCDSESFFKGALTILVVCKLCYNICTYAIFLIQNFTRDTYNYYYICI